MSPKLAIIGRACRNNNGAAAIEFAFIAMILMMTTLGVFELGRVLFTYHRLATAIGTTTRLIEMQAANDVIEGSIRSRFSADEQDALTIQVNPNFDTDGIVYTRIEAQYALPLIMPNFNIFSGGGVVTLQSSHMVPTS